MSLCTVHCPVPSLDATYVVETIQTLYQDQPRLQSGLYQHIENLFSFQMYDEDKHHWVVL